MGKQSKTPKKVMEVSIVTVTQLKRKETILVLVDLIKQQTYKNITQWVIVEGSPLEADGLLNADLMCLDLQNDLIKIDYIPWSGKKLGELRNMGNRKCTGDITVCMDDDDYYPPTRVEHAVKALTDSKFLLAGCSEKYLYDYHLERLYKFKSFGPYHSTNDCMAWKREFIKDDLSRGHHDPTACNAEEASFTKKFSEPMVQLDPFQTIVGNSHDMNTFDKKEICVLISIGIYPNGTDEGSGIPMSIMKESFFERYSKLYKNTHVSDYDIVYFTGGTSIEWNPTDKSLGGSEQAVVHLATEWVKLGKRVAVYGKIPECQLNGVDFLDWKTFKYSGKYKTLVLWRLAGVNCMLQFPINAEKLFVDLHDNIYQFRFDYSKYAHKIDKIFFKSNYHLECYNAHFKEKLPVDRYTVIVNGIRESDFNVKPKDTPERNPFRFCYCSCYTRGLAEILMYIWPVVHKYEPRAEFHVYYGMNYVQDQQFKQQMLMLLSQPGVMDHGRVGMDLVIREKWQSSFHLYITDTTGEIDCISIRESLSAGCIPLLSKFGVFKDRDGIHFDLVRDSQESYSRIAQGILNLLAKPELHQMFRDKLLLSPTLVGWNQVAQAWLAN